MKVKRQMTFSGRTEESTKILGQEFWYSNRTHIQYKAEVLNL